MDTRGGPQGDNRDDLHPPSATSRTGGKISVSILVLLLGISSWLAINGIWSELPVLVHRLPEGWYLASYIAVLTQVANISPLIYSIIRKCISNLKRLEEISIHLILLVGGAATLLLSFFWDNTLVVAGKERSVAFLFLTFLLAVVDCTSSVLFFPYMAGFKATYLLWLMSGEGMSGLVPSLVALGQGVGGQPKCKNFTVASGNVTKTQLVPVPNDPRFPTSTFFLILTGMITVSYIAYVLLQTLPLARQERVKRAFLDHEYSSSSSDSGIEPLNYRPLDSEAPPIPHQPTAPQSERTATPLLSGGETIIIMRPATHLLLLCMQAFICFITNGVLVTVQTFSALPYGNLVFHLAVNLSSLAHPVVCVLAMWWPTVNVRLLVFQLLGAFTISCYLMATAVLSPSPPLVGTLVGSILIVSSWVLYSGLMSYLKACIASLLRRAGGHSSLFKFGVVTQVGSFIGAVIMFFVVNYTHIFKSYNPCS